MISHVDMEYLSDFCGEFFDTLIIKPDLFLYGYGGGDPKLSIRLSDNSMQARINEFAMIIDIEQWKEFGVSFSACCDEKYNYDTSCKLYYEAYYHGKTIHSLSEDPSHADFNRHYRHFVGSSKERRVINEEHAIERLKEYPNVVFN